MSTPFGEPIIAKRVYCNCIATVYDSDTLVELVYLYILDFDFIIGMDWLSSCYAIVDCRAMRVHFYFSMEGVLE